MKRPFYFFIAFALFLSSCNPDDEDKEDHISVNQEAFLANTADIIIVPAYAELNASVHELQTSIEAFAPNLTSANLNDVQSKLKTAYLNWQKVSHFEFGPAETVGLRSSVNVFPVDETQVESNVSSGTANLDALSNKVAKGFPALDYLLHESENSTLLVKFSNQNRIKYLQDVVADLKTKVVAVNTDWGDYKNTFKTSTGTDVGSSTGILINTLTLHFEKFFRDNKIGIPSGVRSSGISRPEFCEAQHGEYSVELVLANLQAMKRLFIGTEVYGLDDYLQASDASTLSSTILSQFDVIEMRLNALSDPLPAQISSDPAAVQSAYNEMQRMIVYLKVDIPSKLGVLITYQDNDGD